MTLTVTQRHISTTAQAPHLICTSVTGVCHSKQPLAPSTNHHPHTHKRNRSLRLVSPFLTRYAQAQLTDAGLFFRIGVGFCSMTDIVSGWSFSLLHHVVVNTVFFSVNRFLRWAPFLPLGRHTLSHSLIMEPRWLCWVIFGNQWVPHKIENKNKNLYFSVVLVHARL